MKTEIPRTRQLTFQLEHAPCVLIRRALAAVATAPSHPLPAGRSRNSFTPIGGVIAEADKKNCRPVFLHSQEKERHFLPDSKSGVSPPEMR